MKNSVCKITKESTKESNNDDDLILSELENSELQNYQKILLAVSGGADSLVLLDSITKLNMKNKKIHLQIACVDHNLRKEAADEAQFVIKQAEKRNVKAKILKWNHQEKEQKKIKLNKDIAQIARNARYKILWKYAQYINAQAIVTAHTLEDNIETFIMRLQKGSGIKGLSVMQKITCVDKIKIIRPFLNISKKDIEKWCVRHQLKPINDPSNQNEKFERVKTRIMWEEMQNKFHWNKKNITKTIQKIQDAQNTIENLIEDKYRKYCNVNPIGYVEIEAEILLTQQKEIALGMLAKIIRLVGGMHKYNARSSKQNQQLLSKIQKKNKEKKFDKIVCSQTLIFKKKQTITFAREARRNIPEKMLIKKNQVNIFDNRFICKKKLNDENNLFISYADEEFLRYIEHSKEDQHQNIKNNLSKIEKNIWPTIPIIKSIAKLKNNQNQQNKYYIPQHQQKNSQYLSFFCTLTQSETKIIPENPFEVSFQNIHSFRK